MAKKATRLMSGEPNYNRTKFARVRKDAALKSWATRRKNLRKAARAA